jgi:hypothetical protein
MGTQGEDNMIADTEIDVWASDTQDTVHNFKVKLLQERVAPLVGKTLKIERTLKDSVSGVKQRVVLDATVTGARWTYEDGIDFTVTYVHPFTGKTVATEEGA